MNLDAFVRDRNEAWSRLETLVQSARRKAESLGPEGVLELGDLYRAAAADLALARRAFPGDPVVSRLERLVAAARTLVYAVPSRRGGLLRFVAHGYWRLVAERALLIAVAAALLFGPALLAGAWALDDPGAAAGLVPGEYQSVTQPRAEGEGLGLAPDEEAAFSAAIMTNNIRVTLLAFAAGIFAGLGTAAVLIINGVLLGVVGGLAVGAGNGRPFFELVAAHGVLELSCILVAGAAGLRFGWAHRRPGHGDARRGAQTRGSSRAGGRAGNGAVARRRRVSSKASSRRRESASRGRSRSASCSARCTGRSSCSSAAAATDALEPSLSDTR